MSRKRDNMPPTEKEEQRECNRRRRERRRRNEPVLLDTRAPRERREGARRQSDRKTSECDKRHVTNGADPEA